MGYSFRLTAWVVLYASSLTHTTVFVTPVVEHWLGREITNIKTATKLLYTNSGIIKTLGAGCSSVDSVPAFEAVGRQIDPSQWTQLQFGLFSVPTRGPQLVYQTGLFCLWKSAYKRSLAAYRKA